MRGDVLISLVDSDAVRIEGSESLWFGLGLKRTALADLRAGRDDPTTGRRIVRSHANASIIRVTPSYDGVDVQAWRGLVGLSDIYHAICADGTVLITDHFRNAVASIPMSDRSMSPIALTEHYICNWVYDRRTHSEGVSRLACGDHLRVDSASGVAEYEVFVIAEPTSDPSAVRDVVERVDAALAAAIEPMRSDPDTCMTFSGGVDSTLLASYVDDQIPLVAITTDTPEFKVETEYAEAASGLLGRSFERREVLEVDFLDLLVDTIDRMATPPGSYVVPMLFQLFRGPETNYILGDGADSIFGTDRGLRRIAGALANPLGLGILRIVGEAPGRIGFRGRQVKSYADRFALPTGDLYGAAATSLGYEASDVAEAIFGREMIEAVFRSHLDTILDRVAIESLERDRFYRHTEISGWRNTMADLITHDRLQSLPLGKRPVHPYVDEDVVAAFLTVPPDRRYVKGVTGKWVLKEILKRRVPGFPVNQRKNATGLPFNRYYKSGPLRDIWDHFEVPEVIADGPTREVIDEPTPATWNAITHAIWTDRIVKNGDLEPHPAALRELVTRLKDPT